jgi:hypothetical protein
MGFLAHDLSILPPRASPLNQAANEKRRGALPLITTRAEGARRKDRQMDWKKSKVVTFVWTADAFKIVETTEPNGRRFRLESQRDLDEPPVFFPALEDAKRHASVINELALFRAENARLRSELAQQRGEWPSPEEIAEYEAAGDTEIEEGEEEVADGIPDEEESRHLSISARTIEEAASSPPSDAEVAASTGSSVAGTTARRMAQEARRQAAVDCGSDGRGVPQAATTAKAPWF